MNLSEIFHRGYVAFTQRHAIELDAWEANSKRDIAELAEFHRRGIAQRARSIRVNLLAARPSYPDPHDPDYLRVLQAKRNREARLMLDAVDTMHAHETRLRLAVDQPFFILTPKGIR